MYREILPEEVKVDKSLGYEYFIDTLHPLASPNIGRVYYHRHIASTLIMNRWLLSYEHVHHIDGNKCNNREDNLLVLSEEEHSSLHHVDSTTKVVCPVCNKQFSIPKSSINKRVTCSTICASKLQTLWNITKEELEILIWNKSYTQIAKEYPISDVGAKKRGKSLGCLQPPRYFFNKTEEFRKEQRKLNNIPDLSTQQSSKLLA